MFYTYQVEIVDVKRLDHSDIRTFILDKIAVECRGRSYVDDIGSFMLELCFHVILKFIKTFSYNVQCNVNFWARYAAYCRIGNGKHFWCVQQAMVVYSRIQLKGFRVMLAVGYLK